MKQSKSPFNTLNTESRQSIRMAVARYTVEKDVICFLLKESTCYSISHEDISSKFRSGLPTNDL